MSTPTTPTTPLARGLVADLLCQHRAGHAAWREEARRELVRYVARRGGSADAVNELVVELAAGGEPEHIAERLHELLGALEEGAQAGAA